MDDDAGSSGSSVVSAGDEQVVVAHPVYPKMWCEHMEAHIEPVPSGGVDAKAPCSSCHDSRENWVCLGCYQVYCSRFIHGDMQHHSEEYGHLIALSLADLSVWCYGCDSYISNSLLQPAKESAYQSKFGEAIPTQSEASSDEDVER